MRANGFRSAGRHNTTDMADHVLGLTVINDRLQDATRLESASETADLSVGSKRETSTKQIQRLTAHQIPLRDNFLFCSSYGYG